MIFIHSQGFVHRDVKPENILLDERWFAQIGDLGSSRFCGTRLTLATRAGIPLYMAPEMYDDACNYTWAVDVYSFALIVYEVFVGQRAFPPTRAPSGMMKKVVTGERPPLPVSMDATVKAIIGRGWSVDAMMRTPFDEILSMLESVGFKVSPRIDSGRVREFMRLVGYVPGRGEADHLSERRSTKGPEGVADAASEELSRFLLLDSELPVSRREFPCVFEKRKKTQKVKKGLRSKNVDIEVDEAISPLDGIIAHLTRDCGGNIPEHGVVKVTGSEVRRDRPEFAAKNAVDLGSDSVFYSGSELEQWLCYDFRDMVVFRTHYSIRSGGEMSPGNWVVEGRKCEADWFELDRREKDDSLKGRTLRDSSAPDRAESRRQELLCCIVV
jgi:serine/threonine protein kinase